MAALASSVENPSGCGLVPNSRTGGGVEQLSSTPVAPSRSILRSLVNAVVAILVLPPVRFRVDDYRV